MTYLQKNSKNSRSYLRVVFITLLFLSGVFFLGDTLRSIVREGISFVAVPIWRGEQEVFNYLGGWWGILASKHTLLAENNELSKEIQDLRIRLLDRTILREENLLLKEALGRIDYEKKTLATVLANPSRSPYDTLILDAGKRDGVLLGDLVIAGDSVIIGSVSRVSQTTSVAVLFSAPQVVTDVIVGGDIRTQAYGRGGGNFEIRVPRDQEVSIGAPVIFPLLSPKVFGFIEEVYVSPADSFQTLLFQMPVNVFMLERVYLIPSSGVASELESYSEHLRSEE